MGSKKKKTTIGYKCFWDLFAGLGRGPVNEIVHITADEKTIVAGTNGQLSTSQSIYIDKPGLFGGSDVSGEGGIQGTLEIAMGEADQLPSDNMKGLVGEHCPGFRGMVTTFFSGLTSAYSASPKPWKYRVRRTTKGWFNGVVWYPEKALIFLRNDTASLPDEEQLTTAQLDNLKNIHAMNPAHILIEAATNKDWGRGLDLDNDIDHQSFKALADTLYAEGFGLCFRYNRQNSLDTFVKEVLDHIGGAQ